MGDVFAEQGGILSATPAGGVTADGTRAPLPGFYVLDAQGQLISTKGIQDADELVRMLEAPAPLEVSSPWPAPTTTERVSIRVSGFVADEGIT